MHRVPVTEKKPGVLVTQRHGSVRVGKAMVFGVSPAAGHAGAMLSRKDCPGSGPPRKAGRSLGPQSLLGRFLGPFLCI